MIIKEVDLPTACKKGEVCFHFSLYDMRAVHRSNRIESALDFFHGFITVSFSDINADLINNYDALARYAANKVCREVYELEDKPIPYLYPSIKQSSISSLYKTYDFKYGGLIFLKLVTND